MARDIDPTILRQFLRYDPETGKLFWRERTAEDFSGSVRASPAVRCRQWNTRYASKEAFIYEDVNGYLRGEVKGYVGLAHRIIWAIYHGEWPENVDHINGIKSDNRLANLRTVTKSENARNQKLNVRNTSGCSGVSLDSGKNLWLAEISAAGKPIRLGYFRDLSDAIAARKQAEQELGYHPNHGQPDAMRQSYQGISAT